VSEAPQPVAGASASNGESRAIGYIREKVDQLLKVMGTAPLRAEELDDQTLLELDPIGIIAASFGQVLAHQKETNLRLRQARDEIAAIFESAGAGIMVLDAGMRILAYNRKQEEFFSRAPGSVIGEACCSVMCRGKRDAERCTFELVLLGERTVHQPDWTCEGRHFDVVGTPIRDERGEIGRVVLVYTDITEHKRMEEELRQAKENLERQNAELKHLDRMKDGLIRDVSHELKTPVAKHLMQLELLRPLAASDRLTPGEKKSFFVMRESIRRQESVIRNLLDLSRLESGGRSYTRREVSLNAVIDEVLKDYQYALDSYHGRVTLDAEPVHVVSDEEMLWHVFSNLLNNAVKFRQRTVPLHVEITVAARGEEAIVRFADNGIGLLPEELARVFERFYQSSPAAEGSGVGLAICRQIIEDLEGRIQVESAGRNRGVAVTVALPLRPG
jgi:PAS domain S-box-containing protein